MTLTATHLHPRGFDFERSQFYDLTLGTTTQRFDPPFPCRGGGDCSGQTTFINTLNCEHGGQAGPEMMSIVEILEDTTVTHVTAACAYGTPSLSGRAVLFHRFFNAGHEPVLEHDFEVDLTQPTARLCPAVFPGNTAALVLELTSTVVPAPVVVEVDSDGDGISDVDEAFGADTDCDGLPDVRWDLPSLALGGVHEVRADSLIPDVYVEVDWMDCSLPRPGQTGGSCQGIFDPDGNPDMRSFEPDWVALEAVAQVFADHGINLHIVRGEALPVMGRFEPTPNTLNKISLVDEYLDHPDPNVQDAQLVWDLFFGTEADRDPSAAGTRAHKAEHIRYAIFNHANQGGGYAWKFGDMFRVASHPNLTIAEGNLWGDVTTDFDRARVVGQLFMHELGHSLGLDHGGQDPSPNKPNQFSVMTYRPPSLDDPSTPVFDRGLNYNEIPGVLDLCDLDEDAPLQDSPTINWTTSWTCPDITQRGTGSILGPNDYDCDGVTGEVHQGSLIAGECRIELREPFYCVRPGPDNVLDTVPLGGDRRAGGAINAGGNGFLQTDIATDATGKPLDDIDLDVATLTWRILPGPDGTLDSVPGGDDQRVGEVILPGGNLWCNTAPSANDEPGNFGLEEPSCNLSGDPVPGGLQPCNLIKVVDEWAILRFDLLGNVSGAYQGPPLTSPVEPTEADLAETMNRSNRADVGLSSTVAMSIGAYGPQATVSYELVNFGPHRAVQPMVQIELPAGADLIQCQVQGGVCARHENTVIAKLSELSPGAIASVELELLLGCDGTGGSLDVSARLRTSSFDPNPVNDETTNALALEPTLDIGQPGRPWVKSYTSGTPMPVVQSTLGPALALTCGYQAFESPGFSSNELGATATALLVDLFIPQAAWGGWVGNLELFFEAPGLNVWNRWQTTQTLTALPRGQWITLSLPLDAVAQGALASVTPSVRFRFASNLGACGPQVLFANVRLGGDVTCHTAPPPPESIVSSSVLRFETMADWTSSAGALALESGSVSQGSHALRVGPVPWTRLESRLFQTTELAGVTSRFALDVLIPVTQTGTYWLGGLGLVVDCPEAGLYNRWIGYHGLQFLFEGEYNRLEYALPDDVVEVLDTSGHECRIAFELATNPVVGSFVLDGGGFLPEASP